MQHECNTRNARYATRFPRGKIRSTRGLPGDLCTRFRPPREKKRVSEPKNGSDTRFFRLFSTNLIGNFLVKYPLLKLFPLFSVQTHHMYFPGRSPVISSNRARTDRSPYDRYLTASAPSNRYRRGHYSAIRTKSQCFRISQCLKKYSSLGIHIV